MMQMMMMEMEMMEGAGKSVIEMQKMESSLDPAEYTPTHTHTCQWTEHA